MGGSSTNVPFHPTRADIARWRANLKSETDGVAVYRAMAKTERDPSLAVVYARLADAEERHASLWVRQLKSADAGDHPPRPSLRARLLIALSERFGASIVAGTIAALEAKDRHAYDDQPEARRTSLPRDERSHARLLREITGTGIGGSMIALLEGRHRLGGNALRAAVLGADDGLVSNFGLVMGVAGAGGDTHAILIAGLAGLLAGSLSMALGEWLSVQSARELYARQIAIEADELALAPDEEEEELALIYRAKGASEEAARTMAADVMRDTKSALDALAREELAIDPEHLGGSAYVAAGTSFAMFAGGALVPLVPFAFVGGTTAVIAAAILSAFALFGAGAVITLITGQPALRAGLRQLAIGIAAAAITFGVGRLLGAAIS